MLGVLTGLKEEARIIRRTLPSAPIAMSNATEQGAEAALARLLAAGVTKLLSFGCAGSLSTGIAPGVVIVAEHVRRDTQDFACDESLSAMFGSAYARRGGVLHSNSLMERACEKAAAFRGTGCLAVDMESGFVASTGLPFAVLRVVCDDATMDLPPAVKHSINQTGGINIFGLTRSLLRHPRQIPALIRLGQEAASARSAMERFLQEHPPQIQEV